MQHILYRMVHAPVHVNTKLLYKQLMLGSAIEANSTGRTECVRVHMTSNKSWAAA